MAIFAQTSCGVHITHALTSEAARMVQLSAMSRGISDAASAAAYQRTFWVIYILEKTLSFACGRPSVLRDADIGTPVPHAPEAVFGTFDWLKAMSRFSRFSSKVYGSLFSISATLRSPETLYAAVEAYMDELEAWRMSVPEDFRPGSKFPPATATETTLTTMALRLNLYYYSAVVALSRFYLNLPQRNHQHKSTECESALLAAASRIVELTNFIDLASYTPIWVMFSAPLSASFILFDFIVHHPAHPDTTRNLSLLSTVGAYFCHLDYISGGTIPISLLSDMASIARDYVRDNENDGSPGRTAENNSSAGGIPEQALSNSENSDEPLTMAGAAPLDDILAGGPGSANLPNAAGDTAETVDWSLMDRISGDIDLLDLFAGGNNADSLQYYLPQAEALLGEARNEGPLDAV
ncbi:fungal specific transcription factor domain-containing protein [Aspergillus lucknowensis]|uniref:Xylanolytic transcriptional activator regulatory domain-containing protein n=1 Tax=Aspergillus lucknowensis TaxID=176173 RepID=A0ABR4LTZ1_9EURO